MQPAGFFGIRFGKTHFYRILFLRLKEGTNGVLQPRFVPAISAPVCRYRLDSFRQNDLFQYMQPAEEARRPFGGQIRFGS